MVQALTTTGAEDVRWHLEEIYSSPDDPAIERTLAEALDFAREFEQTYKGRIAELPPDEFAAMMDDLSKHYSRSSLPGLYAHLRHTLDTRDHASGRLMMRTREAGAEIGGHLVFFGLEIAQLTDEQCARLYANPAAARYKHAVEQERLYRNHQLTETEERLLTDVSPTATSAWSRLFEELCAAIPVDLEGTQVPLATALSQLREADRAVRESASHAITAALRRDIRTRAYIFNVLLQDKAIVDRLRKYPTWVSSRNLANETSDAAVQALVEAVTGRYDLVARYYRAKRSLLGLDQLYEWDRYAPIDEATRRITWTEAKDMVLASYHRFSPRAGRLVQDFFDKRWIDAPVTDGNQRRADAGARAGPWPARRPGGRAEPHLRLPPAPDAGRDRLGVRGDAHVRRRDGPGAGPERAALDAVPPGGGRVRDDLPAGRDEPVRGRGPQRPPDRGRAVDRAHRRALAAAGPADVRRLPDAHGRAPELVELRGALRPGARLRVRLRVRQPARAVDLPAVPRAGHPGVRRVVPGLPGQRRLDGAGRDGPEGRDGHHRPRLLGLGPGHPGRHGRRGGAPGRRPLLEARTTTPATASSAGLQAVVAWR
ncbi:MAG: M3 family oligoendopeptidase [Chloroflexi bacterium]|nr:MAG: M3 family oligoendopeptidase [Chloroflexota bacterium]